MSNEYQHVEEKKNVVEQWENHQVNWDWFFVKADLSEIYYYDIVYGSYLTLEEWRTSECYRSLE